MQHDNPLIAPNSRKTCFCQKDVNSKEKTTLYRAFQTIITALGRYV